MADFRKWFPVLAIVAVMFGAAVSANAQPAFTCVGNAGVPPIVRAEGLSELVGDVVLNCTGGVPTAAGASVPQVNVQIFLNTNVTSRLLNDPWSEALLMIDEPGPTVQRYCSVNGGCALTGVGAAAGFDGVPDGVDYDDPGAGAANLPNVFQGRQVGANQIVWLGVPIDPPGTSSTRIIRITNVRANANQLGVSSTLVPQQIVMYISATSSTSIPINNPQQVVAFVSPGMTFSTRSLGNFLQCSSNNKDAATDNTKALSNANFAVRFTEGFASAFKRRNATATGNADVSPTPVNQNTPGTNYFTESGFVNQTPTIISGSSANGLAGAGLADHGTRLRAVFSNVPAGVVLYASIYEVTTNSTPLFTATSTAATSRIRLVSTDSNGGGAFSAVNSTNSTGTTYSFGAILTAPITLSNGSGAATWEIMQSNPLTVETVEAAIAVSFTSNTSSNLPGLGTSTVSGSFAPLSTVTTASASAPIPRFADTSSAKNNFVINACSTNLLFPFVTNQGGFDTGLAISNTSVDPFGTAPQSGPCKLNYYGGTTGGGAAPAAQTSSVVAAGAQLVGTLSSGGNLGIAATPGFQGYIIAQCNFQYAHGFAFISDLGSQKLAEGYLALILDSGIASRTGFFSEVLAH